MSDLTKEKVVVIQDGKATVEGLVLAAALYMGAVKDIFSLRSDGPPYNERKVTKDSGALRAFDHLDAATKALQQAISHQQATIQQNADAAKRLRALEMAIKEVEDDYMPGLSINSLPWIRKRADEILREGEPHDQD